jgi:putative ABC transport system permease protein
MLTSVIERTREIGLLKALGSTSRGIMTVFLTEALVTGLLGGVIGVVAGAGLSYVIMPYLGGSSLRLGVGGGGFGGAVAFRGGSASASAASSLAITPVISPEVIALAILLAVAVGAFGGLIPAWRASRLNPVEALKRS